MLKEFRNFAMKGNVVDLAIGVIKALSEALGELTADGGFPGAHHADEKELSGSFHGGIVAIPPRPTGKPKGAGKPAPLVNCAPLISALGESLLDYARRDEHE